MKQITLLDFIMVLQRLYESYLIDENALDYVVFEEFEVING